MVTHNIIGGRGYASALMWYKGIECLLIYMLRFIFLQLFVYYYKVRKVGKKITCPSRLASIKLFFIYL